MIFSSYEPSPEDFTCECNNQVIIRDDCTEGFLCLDEAADFVDGAEGCRRTCNEGELLVPDFTAEDGTVRS